MPTIRVTVYRDNKPAKGHRVVLSYSGFLTGGMSKSQYTDSHGQAFFDAKYGEEGEVYVDGKKKGRWGSYSATDVRVGL